MRCQDRGRGQTRCWCRWCRSSPAGRSGGSSTVEAFRDRILLGGQDKGSGFAITDSRALTAGHVVRAAAMMVGGRNDDAARPP